MKKPDFFNKAASEKLGINIQIVKKVNAYFWKKGVKANLSQASQRAIFIKNFGTITISKYKLNKEIRMIIYKIRKAKVNTHKKETTRVLIINELTNNLKNLLQRRNEIALEFYKPKLHEPLIGVLETNTVGNKEPSTDSGGTDQSGQNGVQRS